MIEIKNYIYKLFLKIVKTFFVLNKFLCYENQKIILFLKIIAKQTLPICLEVFSKIFQKNNS